MKLALVAAVAMLIGAAPPAQTPISLKDPALFLKQLRELGYAPDPYKPDTVNPTTVLHLGDQALAVVLVGCVNKHDCKYIAIFGTFTDISAPPDAWIARMNAKYDLIKISTQGDNKLYYSMGAIVEGLPRPAFRALIAALQDASSDLARQAVAAGYAIQSK